MAEVVDGLPKPRRRTTYPWHEWMDGRAWKLTQGRDFYGSIESMRASVLNAAKRYDTAVKTVVERDFTRRGEPERWLYLQFSPGCPYRQNK